MFTICPKCALTLLVTAEDLRVAQGYVRCGRCSSVFNALARLTEETHPHEHAPDAAPRTPPPSNKASPRQAPAPAASAAATESSRKAGTPPPPPPNMGDEDPIPEDALEFDPTRADVSKVFVEPPANPQWSAATGTFRALRAANQEALPPREEVELVRPPVSPPRPSPPPPPPQASSAVDDDVDIDVEIGPEQLASILRAELAPVPPAAPSPEAAAPARAARRPSVAAAVPAEVPPPRPRTPSSPKRPLRSKPIERPAGNDSGRPAAAAAESAASAPPPLTRHQGPPPPGPAPAQAAAPEQAAEAPPPKPYARVLRLVRPGAGPGLAAYAWGAGAIVMLVALVAQIVNHHRDELAADPRFNHPLTAVYAALGLHLVPHWDLKAYDVRQLGAAVEPGSSGLITVRASVKNGAPQPQPLPLLRVTLQDRFGNRIAARDVAPSFYLSGNAPAFLSAGERIDAEMGFVDPGANAVGFEIDACLPASSGVITCANDSTAR